MSLELHAQLDRLEMICDQTVNDPLDYQIIKDQINVIRNGIIILQLDADLDAAHADIHRSLAHV